MLEYYLKLEHILFHPYGFWLTVQRNRLYGVTTPY
jgi:hypothetical protein